LKHRYLALLRAIKVGGNSIIKMADLRKHFEDCGLTEVATHIQSGNVLFSAAHADPKRLARQLEEKMASVMGRKIAVFVLSPAELKAAAAHNPFAPEGQDKDQRCHLMFLSARPDAAHHEALMALQGRDYRFHVHGAVLYYAYPVQFDGKRRTIDFEKVLGVSGTARNWNVVAKLIELSS
jgi:uncharacterized protein (DUF1697 family)